MNENVQENPTLLKSHMESTSLCDKRLMLDFKNIQRDK